MKHNTPGLFIWDNTLAMSAYWVCSGPIISSLTRYFGFSLALSNLITAFTTILPIIQVVGGLAYGHARSSFRFLRLSSGIWRIFMPLVFFSVLLPKPWGSLLMILNYMLSVGIYQFSASPQISWMSSCVDGQVSGDYYARREMIFMAAYSALFCVVTLKIDQAERTGTQQMGFVTIGLMVAVLMAASLWLLARIPEPPTAPRKAPSAADLLEPLRNKTFRDVIWANLLWSFSCTFVGGFSAVYQVQVLNLSFVVIMLWTTVSNLSRTGFVPIMARLARKIGWKNVTVISALIMVVSSLFWASTTRETAAYLYPAAIVLSIIPFAGLNVGFLKMQISHSPEESRSVYIAVVSLLNGAGALVGSLLCSFLLHRLEFVSASAPRVIFYGGTVFTLIATAAILRLKEPNPKE